MVPSQSLIFGPGSREWIGGGGGGTEFGIWTFLSSPFIIDIETKLTSSAVAADQQVVFSVAVVWFHF